MEVFSLNIARIRFQRSESAVEGLPHLCGAMKECVANSGVIDFELVDSVDVGADKVSLEDAVGAALQRRAHERVDVHKLQLDVAGVERNPLALVQFLDLDCVHLQRDPNRVEKH